ncbi:hypothetical protein [Aquimarina algiphila]|uniref:Uncharacterized protein n=1 Tax=Aquimarina algiphila TaxID=2047982 RepID=A0A554VGB8_9FLAO|nr:hypothetical protein [Aquimarina algiphila]TSE06412.1 hypothetical protein FOF46_19840 [Aquimarina algiphila]
MSEELFEIIRLISLLIVGLPFIVALFKFKILNKTQIVLFYLLLIIILVEIISLFFWYKKINNLPIYHLYTIIEFAIISKIYAEELKSIFSKNFFLVLVLMFAVFSVLNTLFFQNIFTFNSNAITVSGLIVIFFALSYFYALLKEVKYRTLESNPMFWINSGFLIYFSSNLILFYMNNTLFKGVTEASLILWGLHAIVNIVLTIFYTIALWVNPKKQNT